MKLTEVPAGKICTIKSISAEDRYLKRFVEMGLRAGACVKVLRFAPLGDPIEVKLGNAFISIRCENAGNIEVDLADISN
ncbi:FeoA family protein [Sedimentisphaera salicampi]|uniref:Ferrous iron transport protein A n=1 Tax=Sedimentisphaera salicampi TaxID=1941349 RepID=A0A1W6LK86_9BACT|nr:FeoA family protein [Sedimentisphaera salicampi]ARN56210.1 ferrous iron transport protein A [Sedimentisphaera salicampi]OXU15643.1 ferrous iron transport protein A [Sedimentisphaera salicampi]